MSRLLSRRTVLRGLGAALGLPWLEAMTSPATALGTVSSPRRLAFLYIPTGAIMHEWTPKAEGPGFELSPTLAPLEKVRGDLLVLSGLNGRLGEVGPNGHPLASAPWLSSAPVGKKRDRAGFCTDLSIDQMAAARVGTDTRLPSLELGCDRRAENPHTGCISWRGPGAPSGKEVNPRTAFSRLFGDPTGDAYDRSVLDAVLEDARGLRARLGRGDRGKLEEYLEAVRSVESRIQAAERHGVKAPPQADIPAAVPVHFPDHVRLMLDVLTLAFQSDATRVSSFIFDSEGSERSFPFIGVKDSHHGLTHWPVKTGDFLHPGGEGEESMKKVARIDRFYVEQLAYFLEKLKSIPEGEGTLLDQCLIVYGSGLSWAGIHVRTDLPILLAGKGGGSLAPGRHVRYPKGTPLANLWLSLLVRMGVRTDGVADSTRALEGLTA